MEFFEKVLEKSRFMVFIPVISLLLSALFIFVWTLKSFSFVGTLNSAAEKDIIIKLVSAFDLFLLGVIALVFAASLYEMYIKEPGKDSRLPQALLIESLQELKENIGKIVYLIVLITFFKAALYVELNTALELLMLAVALFFIALSLYFTSSKKKGNPTH